MGGSDRADDRKTEPVAVVVVLAAAVEALNKVGDEAFDQSRVAGEGRRTDVGLDPQNGFGR